MHIAVFDNEPSFRNLCRWYLAEANYTVSVHNEDAAGIDEARRMQPAVVILGNFKGTSRSEWLVISQLRKYAEMRSTSLVIATTNVEAVKASPLYDQQHEQILFLTKPFTIGELRACVRLAARSAGYDPAT